MVKNIRIAYFTFFVSGFTSMILNSILPFIINDLRISFTDAGMLLSALSMGNMLSVYTIGFIINRYGIRRIACCASLCAVVGLVGVVFSGEKTIALISFFLVGICRGAVSNINNSVVNDVTDGNNEKLNYLHMFFSLGACFGPIIAAINTKINIQWKILILIGIGLNIGSLYAFTILDNLNNEVIINPSSIKNKKVYRKYIKQHVFIICSLILFFYIGVENSVNGWVVTYFEHANIIKMEMAQALLSLMYFIMVIGRIISAKLAKRIDNLKLMMVSTIGALTSYAVMILSHTPIIIVFSIALIGLFFAPMYPYSISVCSKSLKEDSIAMGILLSVGSLGKIVMPVVVGKMSDIAGIGAGMSVILAAMCILFCLISILLSKNEKNSREVCNEYN